MRLWKLQRGTIVRAVENPDCVTLGSRGRRYAWHYSQDGWVRVAYIDEGTTRVIITVTVRRRGPQEVQS